MEYALDKVLTGEIRGIGWKAVQLPDIACVMVNIKAKASNADNVYLGNVNVTRANLAGDATNETTGFELDAGQETGWIPLSNLKNLYLQALVDDDNVIYMALRQEKINL